MEVLIFLFVLSNTILVQSDDNVAMESNVNYQESYKVHPEGTETGHHQAESYHNVGQTYENGQQESQGKFQINVQNYPSESHLVDNNHNDVKYTHEPQNYQEIHQQLLLSNDLRHKAVNEAHGGQSVTYVRYPQQQVYVQHYPHQERHIIGAQASQLKHINENDGHQKTLGFSSYVEHVSDKEEEEVKTALKEGSVGDIKRLVPKSGISFKIYHNDKNTESHLVKQKPGHQTNFLYSNHEEISQGDSLGHKLKLEVPVTSVHNVQTSHHEFHQPVSGLEGSQQIYLKNEIAEHLNGGHHSIQSEGVQSPHLKGVDLESVYYTQIEGSSHRPPLAEKSSSVAESNYNIQVEHGNVGHATSNIQFSKNSNSYSSSKTIKSKENLAKEIGKIQYRKHYSYPGASEKTEVLKKSLKQIHVAAKPIENIKYEINPHAQTDSTKIVQTNYVSHVPAKTYINTESLKGSQSTSLKFSHTTAAPYVSIEPTKGLHSYISHTTSSPLHTHSGQSVQNLVSQKTATQHISIEPTLGKQGHFVSHSTSSPYVGIEAGKAELGGFAHTTVSPVSHTGSHVAVNSHLQIEPAKTVNKGLISHISPSYTESHTSNGHLLNAHVNAEALKSSFGGHVTHSYDIGSESLKTGHDNLIAHIPTNTYIDAESAKGSQNNFDHQKALEGSTSFGIKHAIGNTENSHETVKYVTPTPEVHVEDVQKQTLTYLVPKIPVLPTPAAVVGNHIHDTSLVEDQNKNFGHGVLTSHALTYPAVSLPVVPEVNGKYFNQPQTIVWTSDHLKQGNTMTANDFHQSLVRLHLPKDTSHHIKTNIELPTSFLSHNMYANQKPVAFYHDVPFVKHQEIHFQPKKHHHVQAIRGNHLKSLPLEFDWNFHKTKLPSVKLNTVLVKPELMTYVQEPVKKIIPILVKKRKTRHNKDVGVIYGKTTGNRGPVKPNNRQEKNISFNLRPEASNSVKIFDSKGDRKNEFSVSASYKVDRSLRNADSS